MITPCTDHKGNNFPSLAAMCRHYGIRPDCYFRRLHKGWPLEEILTTRTNRHYKAGIKDHLGNTYASEQKLCQTYGLKQTTFQRRIKEGWSLEKALTTPAVRTTQKAYDFEGREFPNKTAMCNFHGIERTIVNKRLGKGWSLKEALTTPLSRERAKKREDYIGKECVAQNGLRYKIIGTPEINRYQIRFEDGTESIINNNAMHTGYIRHKTLSLNKNNCQFEGFIASFSARIGDAVFYRCHCEICGINEIMTPQQMMEHKRKHDNQYKG